MSFPLSTEKGHEIWLLKFAPTIQTEERGKQYTGHRVKLGTLPLYPKFYKRVLQT